MNAFGNGAADGDGASHPPSMKTVTFVAGAEGAWRIDRVAPVIGEALLHSPARHLAVHDGVLREVDRDEVWALRGVAGHARYVERAERNELDRVSPPLSRPEAVRAALIPIRKSEAWWALQQDERRAIFEEKSHHIADSMKYLPRIARRLYHSRDLGEPFDFLTWFEFAPEHAAAFEELVAMLRSTEEWSFVEREVDIRLSR